MESTKYFENFDVEDVVLALNNTGSKFPCFVLGEGCVGGGERAGVPITTMVIGRFGGGEREVHDCCSVCARELAPRLVEAMELYYRAEEEMLRRAEERGNV